MKSFLIFSILVFSTNSALAISGDFTCPETHPEYSQVLSELESFKETLKEKLECQEVAVNFDKITNLLSASNRRELMGLVNSSDGKPLSAEAAKKVQNFASSITEEIGIALSLIGTDGFMGLLAGTNKCNLKEKDEFEAIERLTKAAYVATNLVSKVAGPYGVPLQIGASAFYGVVQGLQSYSKRKKHIDFDDFAKREFFEGAVCLMSKFDSDIRKLNNPESHLRHLKNARDEARRVVSALERQDTQIKVVLERKIESQENLEWIEGEIARFSEIAEFKTGGIGPRELQSLKNTINSFLLGTAAPEFLSWYATRAKLSNKDFVRSTGETISALRYDFTQQGLNLDRTLPNEVQQRFPRDRYPYGAPYGQTLNYVMETPEISNLYFISINMKNLSSDAYSFNSLLGASYDLWKLSDLNVRVAQEYCEFFQKTLQYTGEIKNACLHRSFVWYALRTSYQAFYLANLINDNSDLSVLGPFDFRLDKHKEHIKNYNSLRDMPLVLADAGLDFDEVLDLDKTIRIQDGRLKAANDNSPPSFSGQDEWWFSVEEYADQYIEQTEIMGSNL
jgi:hypothetical protein